MGSVTSLFENAGLSTPLEKGLEEAWTWHLSDSSLPLATLPIDRLIDLPPTGAAIYRFRYANSVYGRGEHRRAILVLATLPSSYLFLFFL